MTRTLTPRCLAAITARNKTGSVKRNILMFNERLAALIGSRIASTVSSGRTMRLCDIFSSLDAERQSHGLGCMCWRRSRLVLNAMKLCVNAIASEQFAVRAFFGNDAVVENHNLIGVAYGAEAMGNHDDRPALHQLS